MQIPGGNCCAEAVQPRLMLPVQPRRVHQPGVGESRFRAGAWAVLCFTGSEERCEALLARPVRAG